MENLRFRFEHDDAAATARSESGSAQLVGVVGSGNLEVLIEPAMLDGACEIDITTAAVGFGPIWEAVIADFDARWKLRDTRISVNDMGATPAVVSLRLDQAAESLLGSVS